MIRSVRSATATADAVARGALARPTGHRTGGAPALSDALTLALPVVVGQAAATTGAVLLLGVATVAAFIAIPTGTLFPVPVWDGGWVLEPAGLALKAEALWPGLPTVLAATTAGAALLTVGIGLTRLRPWARTSSAALLALSAVAFALGARVLLLPVLLALCAALLLSPGVRRWFAADAVDPAASRVRTLRVAIAAPLVIVPILAFALPGLEHLYYETGVPRSLGLRVLEQAEAHGRWGSVLWVATIATALRGTDALNDRVAPAAYWSAVAGVGGVSVMVFQGAFGLLVKL